MEIMVELTERELDTVAGGLARGAARIFASNRAELGILVIGNNDSVSVSLDQSASVGSPTPVAMRA